MSDVKQSADHGVARSAARTGAKEARGPREVSKGKSDGDEFQNAVAALTHHLPEVSPFETRTPMGVTEEGNTAGDDGAHAKGRRAGATGPSGTTKPQNDGERRRQARASEADEPTQAPKRETAADATENHKTYSPSNAQDGVGADSAGGPAPGTASGHAPLALEAAALQSGPTLMVMQALEQTKEALARLTPPPRPAILNQPATPLRGQAPEPKPVTGQAVELRALSQAEGLDTSTQNQATFELRHPVFGRIGVRLAIASTHLTLALVARTGSVAESIVAQRESLIQWLSEQGYERVEVTVEVASRRAQRNGKGLASQRDGEATQRAKHRGRKRPGASNLTLDTEA